MLFPRGTAAPYAVISRLYDGLIGSAAQRERVVLFEQLTARFRIAFRSAADLACGTGSFVRYLARSGARPLYGVDSSISMLREALRKNRGNQARFLRQDLRRVRLPRSVELITCNLDSLNYLCTPEDVSRAFSCFRVNLTQGGHAIFDMLTARRGDGQRRGWVEHARVPEGLIVRKTVLDPETSVQVSSVQLLRLGRRDGSVAREVHVQRRYPVKEILILLEDQGLRVLGTFGDGSVSEPEGVGGERVVCVIRRG